MVTLKDHFLGTPEGLRAGGCLWSLGSPLKCCLQELFPPHLTSGTPPILLRSFLLLSAECLTVFDPKLLISGLPPSLE